MKHRGLFRPRYTDKVGTIKESLVWWMRYSCRGCLKHPFGRGIHRESAETESVTQAKRKLESRRGQIADGKGVFEKADRVSVNELFQLVKNDYRNSEQKTLPDVEMRLNKHLLPAFAGRKAQSIRTADVEAFKTKRLEEGAKPATINRELSILQRGFALGVEQDLILNQFCKVKKFPEDNSRQGFITEEQFHTLCGYLPADVRAPIRFAWETGWRTNSEILTREWRHVDFAAQVIRLEASETKNGRAREFLFTTRLRLLLEEQKEEHKRLLRESGILCPFVFQRYGKPFVGLDRRGQRKPTTYFRRSWKGACEQAGIIAIPHDFRRVAVSRFERIGISRKVGMQLSGHLTESIYSRYDIVRRQDLEDAVSKLDLVTNCPVAISEAKK